MRKYALIREMAVARVPGLHLVEAPRASDRELGMAHHAAYIARVTQGLLTPREQREIGFPWSAAMVERSRRSAGATIAACRSALNDGVAVNLAGGTHHAYAEKGSGFCVFNDSAVATRLLRSENPALKVAIVDLDVHQGNGTAAILRGDPGVFTLSIHGQNNFPFRKESSDLDVALPDATGDDQYLVALDQALTGLFACFVPDMIIYLAGADPYAGDRLGRLRLSIAGLAERDTMVLRCAAKRAIPVAVTMGGGYGHVIEETCAIHAQTIALAANWPDWAALREGRSA